MNSRFFGALGVIAVLTVFAGCQKDPLSDLDGTPTQITTNFTLLQIPQGATDTLLASVLDGRATPLLVPITFAACSGGAVSVVVDTSFHPVPATSAQALVTGVSVGSSCVTIRGGGLEDTVDVTVVP